MDLWVVAAATGAGYIAKYWQTINGERDASSDHKHQFNEEDKSQLGISRIWDDKRRPSSIFGSEKLQERKYVWDEGQMKKVTGDESLNLESTSYGVDGHDIMVFNLGIVSLTGRSQIKALSAMPPTICPVLVTDGHRVGRSQEKPLKQPRQRSSYVDDHKGSAAAAAARGVLVFFLIGMAIGVMISAKACKGEMDYLGKKLKNSDSLVQDLIDELDMKDMITVKELDDNDDDNRSKQVKFMSEIETELEDELELVRLQIINAKEPAVDFYWDEEEDDPDCNTQTVKYAVSPKDLKLKLYEVLESRLEARIKELEEALEISHAQERLLTKHHNPSC